ncbi:Na+/H+ antiporter NhaC family protein [Aminicella lysinilytica]|nr:Na+/H+ antiporter NhaC family protein [Aminicella lysinilytica]
MLGKIVNVFGGNPSDTVNAFTCEYGEVHIALLVSATFATIVASLNGYKWAFLEAGILASINRSMQAMLILAEVGLLIGCWVAAGVVPGMIYYGLLILKPSIYLTATCLLCCIVALATGSSWTTAGTIGIALIGVGTGLGISPAMSAGAIITGAYFGDKMSPLSDTTNLAPAMAGATLFDHIRHMIWTVTPSLLIALVVYTILGLKVDKSASLDIVEPMRDACLVNFNLNLWMLLPPVLVIVIVALKIPAIPGIMGGIVAGMIIGSIFNGINLADWPGILHYGYTVPGFSDAWTATEGKYADVINSVSGGDADTILGLSNDQFKEFIAQTGVGTNIQGEYNIDSLINEKGGMSSMLWTINLILCAMCFGGVMDASGMLGAIAKSLLVFAKGVGGLVTVTLISCIIMNIIGGDQYLSIVLPGRMYKEAFEDMHLAPKNLSRCLEDSGTVTSNLIPWNTCGATMYKFLGVPAWGKGGYAPFAILSYMNPIVSCFYGWTGISMVKMTDEEYEAVMEKRAKEKEEASESLEA